MPDNISGTSPEWAGLRTTLDTLCAGQSLILRGSIEGALFIDRLLAEVPQVEFWFISGLPETNTQPFLALSPYLEGEARLTYVPGQETATQVLRAVRKRLDNSPRRVLGVVDRPGRLDLGSAGVLAKLCSEGLIQLAILDRGRETLPSDFSRLLRERKLALVEAGQYNVWQLVSVMERSLGGVVPWTVGARIQGWSGGVEHWIPSTIDAALETGALLQSPTTQVWSVRGPDPVSSEFVAEVRATLDVLDTAARNALICTASAGVVCARDLVRIFGQEALTQVLAFPSVRCDGVRCDCVWMRASLVRTALVDTLSAQEKTRLAGVSQQLGQETCQVHQLPRPAPSDEGRLSLHWNMGAALDLAHAVSALREGRWTRAAARIRSALSDFDLAEGTPMFGALARAASMLAAPLRGDPEQELGVLLQDPAIELLPGLYEALLLQLVARAECSYEQMEDYATALKDSARRRMILELIRVVAAGDGAECLSLAQRAAGAEEHFIRVVALCGMARSAESSAATHSVNGHNLAVLWRARFELQVEENSPEPPEGVRNLVASLPLSAREEELLRAFFLGATLPEIARAFTLSTRTVEWHLGRIVGKFGATKRAELLAALRLSR